MELICVQTFWNLPFLEESCETEPGLGEEGVVAGTEVADGGAKVLTDGGQPAEIADARMPFDLVAAADLAPSPVWRARLAYFPFARALDLPEFEIEVDYREDGVAQRIVQDFGDFSLDVTPVRFETLPAPACGDVVP